MTDDTTIISFRQPGSIIKTLGWETPEEAMAEERAAFRSTVALET